MGCDIHIHAEIRIAGTWHYYAPVDCDRDYELFERIAGVRGDVSEAIALPRGLPNDATFMTMRHYEREREDAHSMTWLSAEEIAAVYEWHKKRPGSRDPWRGYLFGNTYEWFLRFRGDYPADIEDLRFVLWFDS